MAMTTGLKPGNYLRVFAKAIMPEPVVPATVFGAPRMYAPDLDSDQTFVLLTTTASDFQNIVGWINQQGQDYAICTTLKDVCQKLDAARRKISYIMIDVDSFGEIFDVFDDIRKIRDHFVEIPVILASRFFAVSNFEIERLVLCDVSLRIPVTFAHFELALTQAELNNQVWQDRMQVRSAKGYRIPA